MSGFQFDRIVKATRKPAYCSGCSRPIEVGSQAVRWAGLDCNNDFASVIYHTDCRGAEVALNNEQGTWGDEWQSVATAIDDDFGGAVVEWLIADFPAVAARMGIAA